MKPTKRQKAFLEAIKKLEEEHEMKIVPILNATSQGILPTITIVDAEVEEEITKQEE